MKRPELTEQTGIPHRRIARIENEEVRAYADELVRIAGALSVPVSEILAEEGAPIA